MVEKVINVKEWFINTYYEIIELYQEWDNQGFTFIAELKDIFIKSVYFIRVAFSKVAYVIQEFLTMIRAMVSSFGRFGR